MIPEKPGYYYYQWRPDEEIIVQVFDQGGVLESALGRVDAEACRGRWFGAVPGRPSTTIQVPLHGATVCANCPFDNRFDGWCQLANAIRVVVETTTEGPPPADCPLRAGPVEVKL